MRRERPNPEFQSVVIKRNRGLNCALELKHTTRQQINAARTNTFVMRKNKSRTISQEIREIGERLAVARKQTLMSQKDFAAALGISPTTQSNYETGNASPPISYFLELKEMGLDHSFILLDKPSEQTPSDIQLNAIEDLLDEVPRLLKLEKIDPSEPGAIKTALKILYQERQKAQESGIDLKDYLVYKFQIGKSNEVHQQRNLKLALKTEMLLKSEKKKSRH